MPSFVQLLRLSLVWMHSVIWHVASAQTGLPCAVVHMFRSHKALSLLIHPVPLLICRLCPVSFIVSNTHILPRSLLAPILHLQPHKARVTQSAC